jgi:ribosome biogenesis GTPase
MKTVPGTLVAAFGRQYQVELPNGERLLCFPKGKKSVFACGDQVDVEPGGSGQGLITRLHPRHSLLYRADAYKQKLIAANLTQVALIVATEPGFSDELLSRCICAAESQNLRTVIVLNKVDLTARLASAQQQLALFAAVGYPVLALSAHGDLTALHQQLAKQVTIFVGQSGMGKSTLTNALIPAAEAAVAEISTALDSGRHTTTFARRYPLGEHAALIDSPGLQTFGLAHLSIAELEQSFVEFRPWLGQCRFRDCRHENEPGCAILTAVSNQQINERRYNHFRQFYSEIEMAAKIRQGY